MLKWQIPAALIGGMVLGAGAVVLISPLQPSHAKLTETRTSLETRTVEMEALKTQLMQARSDHQAGVQKQEALKTQVAELETRLKTEKPGGMPTSAVMEAASGFLKQMSDGKLVALKSRLNLTPDQEAELRRFFEEEAKIQQKMTEAFMAGEKPSPTEMAERVKSMGSLDDTLKKILTGDQMTLYKKYEEEQSNQLKETSAQRNMNEIATLFSLDDTQKDKVFAVFYEEEEFQPKLEGVAPEKMSTEMDRQRHEFTKAKLKEVLTPAQLEIWSKQQEAQMKAQEEMMLKMKKFLPE
jgi:hypothetical protein